MHHENIKLYEYASISFVLRSFMVEPSNEFHEQLRRQLIVGIHLVDWHQWGKWSGAGIPRSMGQSNHQCNQIHKYKEEYLLDTKRWIRDNELF